METGCVYKCVYNMSIVNSTQRKMKRKQIKLGIIMLSKISQGERGRERKGGRGREVERGRKWHSLHSNHLKLYVIFGQFSIIRPVEQPLSELCWNITRGSSLEHCRVWKCWSILDVQTSSWKETWILLKWQDLLGIIYLCLVAVLLGKGL